MGCGQSAPAKKNQVEPGQDKQDAYSPQESTEVTPFETPPSTPRLRLPGRDDRGGVGPPKLTLPGKGGKGGPPKLKLGVVGGGGGGGGGLDSVSGRLKVNVSSNQSFNVTDSGTFQAADMKVNSRGASVFSPVKEGAEEEYYEGGAGSASASPTKGSAGQSQPASGRGGAGGKRETISELSPSDVVVLRFLGAGASGKVYKAYHRRTASIVALKVISVFDRTVRRQMMKELKANVMHASNVPNMCGFLGAYYDEGSVSMALE
jgi:hypothetical protein